MDLKLNCFPVEFSGGKIRLWRMGNAPKGVRSETNSLLRWTENGKQYHWPETAGAIPSEMQVEEVKPFAVPGLAKAVIRHGLLESDMGMVRWKEEELMMKLDGEELVLSILPPAPPFSQFHLSLRPRKPQNRSLDAYRLVNNALEKLQSLCFNNGAGTAFVLGEEPDGAEYEQFTKPKLYFRLHGIGNKADKWTGISESGPLSFSRFCGRELNCLVIAPERKGGSVKRFLGELKNGFPIVDQDSHFNNPFPGGWSKIFRFKDWKHQFRWMRGAEDWESLEEIVMEEVRECKRAGLPAFDLALVAIPSQMKDRPRLFAEAQACFLELGIPCQALDLSAAKEPMEKRAKALRRLALNGYVKVGGIPWLLPTDANSDRLVVVGVGSTQLHEGIAGYCTLFNRDGTFRLGNASLKPSYEDWMSDLAEFVRSQIAQLAHEDNWEEGDKVELIFHLPDSDHFEEVGKLKSQLKDELLAWYKCSISFLEIDGQHQDRMWDLSRRGRGIRRHAAYVPKIGQACIMDDWALLQLRGADHPEVESPPLKITLHPDSDGRDLNEFTRQVFRFAAISWRHFGMGDLPATLEYGNALTESLYRIDQVGRLPQLEKAIHNYPEIKTWFL